MKTILSWSGGKDSSLTLQALRADPRVDVVALLTSVTTDYDRISIHGVRRELLEAQVRSIGLPLVEIPLSAGCSNADYESAFHAALARAAASFPGLGAIAFGDLFLEDVRQYRERTLAGTKLEPLFPIWGEDTEALAWRFIADGFKAHLVCVDTTQLAADFAGREFDAELLADLPKGVDPCGEHGEFHTFVSDGPVLRAQLPVEVGDVILREARFAYCDLVTGA